MPKAKVKKSRYMFLFLRIAFVVCGIGWGIYWLSGGDRWANMKKIFLQMNLWVLAATLGIFIFAQMIVGFRWWLLLRAQSIFIEYWAAVRLHFLGWFYNNFMPGSVGGDLIRAWYVTKHTDKRLIAALSVFVDRAVGLLSTLAIAAFFYTLFLRDQGIEIAPGSQRNFLGTIAQYKHVLFGVVVVLIVVFCIFGLHHRGRQILKKLLAHIIIYGAKATEQIKEMIIIYCRRPLPVFTAFGLTVFLQLMTITGFWFLAVNMGITASIKYYYVFFPLTWVLGTVPVSIGGAVVVEGALYYLFTHFTALEPEAALAIALCQRMIWMLASLPGAVIHLTGAHLPKDFFVDYEESIN